MRAPLAALALVLSGCGDGAGGPASAPGTLDPSFGMDGVVTTRMAGAAHDRATAVVAQPDGKVVVVGSTSGAHDVRALLLRYRPNGTLDSDFGDGGVVTTDLGRRATGVALQPDGKIVVALEAPFLGPEHVLATARFDATGVLDPSFGDGGRAAYGFRAVTIFPAGVVVQPQGRIVVTGTVVLTDSNGVENENVVLAAFDAGGALDPAFSGDGIAGVDLGAGGDDHVRGAALQPDGAIVVAGGARADFAAARFDAAGILDVRFGVGGRVLIDGDVTLFGSRGGGAAAVQLQPDGRILLAGHYDGPLTLGNLHASFTVARIDAEGALDPTYGEGGIVLTDVGGPGGAGDAVLQPDGKLVVVGDRDGEPLLARYTADGRRDVAFGEGGLASIPLGRYAWTHAAALHADGAIIVVGEAQVAEQETEIFAARVAAW